jgi:hypothetical protein
VKEKCKSKEIFTKVLPPLWSNNLMIKSLMDLTYFMLNLSNQSKIYFAFCRYIISLESKFTDTVKIFMGFLVGYSVFTNVF